MTATTFAPVAFTVSDAELGASELEPDTVEAIAARSGFELDVEARASIQKALDVAARPSAVVVVAVNRAGSSDLSVTECAVGNEGEVLLLGGPAEQRQAVIVGDAISATALLDDQLGISMHASTNGRSFRLDARSFAGLLALADATRAGSLALRLGRIPVETSMVVTAADLEAYLRAGLEEEDTRWAVTAVQAVASGLLAGQPDAMDDSLVRLDAAGIVDLVDGQARVTPEGGRLVTSLGQLAGTTRIVRLRHGHRNELLLIRSASTIISAVIDGGYITVAIDSNAEALGRVSRWLEADSPMDREPEEPGEVLTTPVEPKVLEATYEPTHVVPTSIRAWSEPDPTIEPVETLDAGLDVMLLEAFDNGWGHVRCSNGWECWLDARELVAR